MRIPIIINRNTFIEYQPSEETKQLVNEINRALEAEVITRSIPPTLLILSIEVIAKNFENYPIINQLLLCADRDYLLETVPDNLPLELVIPLIDDDIYWARIFKNRFGISAKHLHPGWTWRCVYLERHMEEIIQQAQPELCEEDTLEDITTLLSPFIHRLVLAHMQPWKPPLSMEKEDIPDIWPIDHINLEPIFSKLVNIEELDVMYGVKNIGDDFKHSLFSISMKDIRNLGVSLVLLTKLRYFRLRYSNVDSYHIQALTKNLINVLQLEVLDISNCLIGDHGAKCIAKLIMVHGKLNKLILTNNLICGEGGEAIGWALVQENCCPLKYMNLRLNPLGHRGVMGIFRALVRVQKLEELIISGAGFTDETSVRLGTVLQLQEALKFIDISNNFCHFGETNILEGIMINSSLTGMDLRETNISREIEYQINKKLAKNRRGGESSEEEEEIEEEEEEAEAEEEEAFEEEEEEEEEEKAPPPPPYKKRPSQVGEEGEEEEEGEEGSEQVQEPVE